MHTHKALCMTGRGSGMWPPLSTYTYTCIYVYNNISTHLYICKERTVQYREGFRDVTLTTDKYWNLHICIQSYTYISIHIYGTHLGIHGGIHGFGRHWRIICTHTHIYGQNHYMYMHVHINICIQDTLRWRERINVLASPRERSWFSRSACNLHPPPF